MSNYESPYNISGILILVAIPGRDILFGWEKNNCAMRNARE